MEREDKSIVVSREGVRYSSISHDNKLYLEKIGKDRGK